jgi:hypothetical protein
MKPGLINSAMVKMGMGMGAVGAVDVVGAEGAAARESAKGNGRKAVSGIYRWRRRRMEPRYDKTTRINKATSLYLVTKCE